MARKIVPTYMMEDPFGALHIDSESSVAQGVEIAPGVIVQLDQRGSVVGVTILDFRERLQAEMSAKYCEICQQRIVKQSDGQWWHIGTGPWTHRAKLSLVEDIFDAFPEEPPVTAEKVREVVRGAFPLVSFDRFGLHQQAYWANRMPFIMLALTRGVSVLNAFRIAEEAVLDLMNRYNTRPPGAKKKWEPGISAADIMEVLERAETQIDAYARLAKAEKELPG